MENKNAYELGKDLGFNLLKEICTPKFMVSYRQHKRIMEILGITNNQVKKEFERYLIITENNGYTKMED